MLLDGKVLELFTFGCRSTCTRTAKYVMWLLLLLLFLLALLFLLLLVEFNLLLRLLCASLWWTAGVAITHRGTVCAVPCRLPCRAQR